MKFFEKAKSQLKRIHWLLTSQLGLDVRLSIGFFFGIYRYVQDFRKFKRNYLGKIELVPCLHDWRQEGGVADSEYFVQDLCVARWVFRISPQRHLDVGSRIDGFVAHIASFREVEVFDVRVVKAQIPGIIFRQVDFTRSESIANYVSEHGRADSLSCLHALEHFGLGRYGDPIDPLGYRKGIENLSSLLEYGGRLYLSTPIGRQRVKFNANWIFDPRTIVECAKIYELVLVNLLTINQDGENEFLAIDLADEIMNNLGRQEYSLGIFVFEKRNSTI